MEQEVIVGLLFAMALFFLVRMVYKTFTQKENCSGSCSCSHVSMEEIEKKMKADKRFESSPKQSPLNKNV